MEPVQFAFIGGLGGMEILLILALLAVGILLPLFALVDLIRRQSTDGTSKILWALVILVFPLFGSLAYLVAGRKS